MQLFVVQNNKIASQVQAELKRQEKKQKDLAEYMGISEAALSRLLAGDTLKQSYMSKISSFLGVDLSFFTFNSNLKSTGSDASSKEVDKADKSPDVEYLKEIIKKQDQIIASKDELIQTLKEKLRK